MSTVRAKFRVISVTRTRQGCWDKGEGRSVEKEVQTITLYPVTDTGGENAEFYASTPSGKIELGTVNAHAAAAFELGRECYCDFTPA